MNWLSDRLVDRSLWIITILVNLLMIAIFLSRVANWQRGDRRFGIVLFVLGIPVAGAVLWNVIGKRPWWTVVLPALLIAFLIVELLFDYILKLNFRSTALLGPYLGLYYLGLIGMVGYSFSVGKLEGFSALGVYFLNLLATWYSYSRVGHGT